LPIPNCQPTPESALSSRAAEAAGERRTPSAGVPPR
jgi:hypothetical protein